MKKMKNKKMKNEELVIILHLPLIIGHLSFTINHFPLLFSGRKGRCFS